MGSPIRLEALGPAQVCDIDPFDETASLRDDPGFMRVMFEVVRSRGPVHLPMSRADIAEFLAITAETGSRILSPLPEAGLFGLVSPAK